MVKGPVCASDEIVQGFSGHIAGDTNGERNPSERFRFVCELEIGLFKITAYVFRQNFSPAERCK